MNAVERLGRSLFFGLAVLVPPFVLVEVNYPLLTPLGALAVFAGLGTALVYLEPLADGKRRRGGGSSGEDTGRRRLPRLRFPPALAAAGDLLAAGAILAVAAYLVVQTEPAFRSLWLDGRALGDRAGAERGLDLAVGAVGLFLVLEATRRSLGWALPLLAVAFLAYARLGPELPDLLLPHRGYPWGRIVAQTFLHSQGVFGVALQVMFSYVFLFVLFGVLLEACGATGFVIGWTQRLFRGRSGGAAKVAVLSSGFMGSLSGSAVANTATTGTFTIPMMRSSGFSRPVAAGLEAAASSGGALVPPVMGAGAYMMLEIVDPPVTYLEIIRAAILPALLYYLSLFLIVHLWARKVEARRVAGEVGGAGEGGPSAVRDEEGSDAGEGAASRTPPDPDPGPPDGSEVSPTEGGWAAGAVFGIALASLLGFLFSGYSVFRSVTLAMGAALVVATLHPATRLGPRRLVGVLVRASRGGLALVTAAAAVGVVIGVVTLTGAGTRLPALILPLAQDSLLAALALLMVSSLVLGMGLPSAVCYLLLATLVGPVLGQLGVVPLAAHFFIFYFGLMSMVTPPVALAAYAASSIAGSPFLASSWAAFRFALVGFTLPFLFVFRPQLLMLDPSGEAAGAGPILLAVTLAGLGIVPFAAAIAGWFGRPLGVAPRAALLVAACLALVPGVGPLFGSSVVSVWNLAGIVLFVGVSATLWRGRRGR